MCQVSDCVLPWLFSLCLWSCCTLHSSWWVGMKLQNKIYVGPTWPPIGINAQRWSMRVLWPINHCAGEFVQIYLKYVQLHLFVRLRLPQSVCDDSNSSKVIPTSVSIDMAHGLDDFWRTFWFDTTVNAKNVCGVGRAISESMCIPGNHHCPFTRCPV